MPTADQRIVMYGVSWLGIEIQLLHGDRYEPASRSALFPELDLDLLVSFLDHPTLTQAMRAYREALGR